MDPKLAESILFHTNPLNDNCRFTGSVPDIILDEIALDGLDGISLNGLWIRLSEALNFPLPLLDSFRFQTWEYILSQNTYLDFYELPEPRAPLKTFIRSEMIDEDLGLPLQPDECPFTTYKLKIIKKDGEMGSCEDYDTRKKLNFEDVKNLSLQDVEKRWGDKFIIVACQDLREHALIPPTTAPFLEFTGFSYCCLERIGRARYNGEITCGKHSLQTFLGDVPLVAYIRLKLLNDKLILKQSYCEKISGINNTGTLITLPRFFTPFRTKPMIMMESIITLMKSRPYQVCELSDIKNIFSAGNEASLKKLTQTQLFRKFISNDVKVPYRHVYPNATPIEYTSKKKGRVEKTLSVYGLLNPNVTIDEIFNSSEVPEKECKEEYFDTTNVYLNMSAQKHALQIIESYGEEGISQTELGKLMALQKFLVRQLLKNMCLTKLITFYRKDAGRQRLKKFMSYKYHNPKPPVTFIPQEMPKIDIMDIKRLKDTPIPVSPEKVNENIQNGLNFEVTIKESSKPPIRDNVKNMNEKRFTLRQHQRNNLILAILNSEMVIDMLLLSKLLIEEEKKLGYPDKMCRKSLSRIIWWLTKEKRVKAYDVTVKFKENLKLIHYVCHPSIEPDNIELQREIDKVKQSFQNSISQRIIRLKHESRQLLMKTQKPIIPRKTMMKLKPPPKVKATKITVPKFVRLQAMHELLFYLVYEQDKNQSVIQKDIAMNSWQKHDPGINFDDIKDEIPPAYSSNIVWNMFIPPIPERQCLPSGWCVLSDILCRIPLSFFIKLQVLSEYATELLKEYLCHPIRKFYIITTLPEHIQASLYGTKRYIQQFDEDLKLLFQTGLIQFGKLGIKDKLKSYIYLNRNAKLLDTTSSEPGYIYTSPDKEYKVLSFQFNTMQDLFSYWESLQNISLTTRLGYRTYASEKQAKRSNYKLKLSDITEIDRAVDKDIGYIPGDKKGAAGLDSSLYAYSKKNWAYSRMKVVPISSVLRPKRHGEMRGGYKGPRKTTTLSAHSIAVRKTDYHRRINRLKLLYDRIDKEALKRMDKLRVSWPREQDNILIICRVALDYLNPAMSNKLITGYTLRDILHWSVNALDKTSKACIRRIRYILRDKKNLKTVTVRTQEIMQNKFINQMFGKDFLVNLKKVYNKTDDLLSAARIFFVQLIYYLSNIFNDNNRTKKVNSFILPDSIDKFNLVYRVVPELDTDPLKHTNPETLDDIHLSTISNLIHSSVCSGKDKTVYNIQLFEIYKKYDEHILARAFEKVREDQLIVTTKCNQSLNVIPIYGRTFHLSNIYCNQFYLILPYFIIGQYYETSEMCIANFFQNSDQTDKKITVDFTTVNSGTCFFIAEMATRTKFDFQIETPKHVLKMNPAHELHNNKSNPEKIMTRFRQIFDRTEATEYRKQIEKECGNTKRKINYNFNVDILKIHYNPYDLISKLSDHYIHCFCILKNLNREINLNNFELTDNLCPVEHCILKDENYLENLTKIIHDNQDLLFSLDHGEDQDNHQQQAGTTSNQSEDKILDGTSIVKISNTNCLEIFERYQKHVQDSIDKLNKKDYGKVSCEKKTINILQIISQIVHNLSIEEEDQIEHDEYEHTFNRDEISDKIYRFHDLLVINIPRIKMSYCTEDDETMVMYKNMKAPKDLVEVALRREDILQKILDDSLWEDKKMSEDEFVDEMRTEGFSEFEQNFTNNLLDYIKARNFGVSAEELVNEFKKTDLLQKSIRILRKHFFIKRVGVKSHIYVYKLFILPWIVNTYNIKRLERESIQPSTTSIQESGKRNASDTADDEYSSNAKRMKPDPECSNEAIVGKRISKPTDRYVDEKPQSSKTVDLLSIKEPIILRPCPWVRVNGSLNRRVLDKWLGTVLLSCISNCGQSVTKICQQYHLLHPVNTVLLLEVLRDLDCIEMRVYKKAPVTLFSAYQPLEIEEATELSNFDEAFVVAKKDAVNNLGIFTGDKKYKSEFI